MGQVISLLTPILLHMAATHAAALAFAAAAGQYGFPYDPALAAALGNLLVIPAALWMCRRDGKPERSPLETAGARACFGLLCLGAGVILNIAWSGLLYRLRIQEYFSNEVQERLLGSAPLIQILGLGIAAPVAEELIFRRLTYRRMRGFFPKVFAVVLSALLFAVYHGNPIQIIFAFPLAVVLALIYDYGKLCIFPILFHIGVNLSTIFLQ